MQSCCGYANRNGMRQAEKNLIDILICDTREEYNFPHDKRFANYMYSTWGRYDLCIRILQRENYFDPYLLRSELELSDRQINNCLGDLIAEGWVDNCIGSDGCSCNYRKSGRLKYKCIRAGEPMRIFWRGYTDWFLKTTDELLAPHTLRKGN